MEKKSRQREEILDDGAFQLHLIREYHFQENNWSSEKPNRHEIESHGLIGSD